MARTKGIFLLKQTWYSICSRHYEYDDKCEGCKMGVWTYNISHFFSGIIYKIFPSLWKLYMNRENSKARKKIKEWFPKLK